MPIDSTERDRRRALLEEHYAAENDRDLDRIMATFAGDAVMSYNRLVLDGEAQIRSAHTLVGMSDSPGAFSGFRHTVDADHYTDEEVVVEGRMFATHSDEFLGFAPTERDVELPFVAFYRFDHNGKLASERIVMNLGPLHGQADALDDGTASL